MAFSSEVMITVVSFDPDIYFTYKAALQSKKQVIILVMPLLFELLVIDMG